MCLAIPGKIMAIKNQLATVDFNGIEKEINISLVSVKVGEYVMVHAGFAIEKMDSEYVNEMQGYLSKKSKISNYK
ncbi:MAG: HypC/HybG/HupF family hydrogenase formation chaperone [Parcubacteria group bacterium]|jgi:hydrogenase expression/formation protein HypC